MKAEEIEKIIDTYAVPVLGPEPIEHAYVDGIGLAAEVIANAHAADLSAAREQLAEMRALLHEAEGLMATHGCYEWCARKQRLLSAAPAGGRVLFRGEAHHREFCTLHLPRKADDALGKPEFEKIVDITIRKALPFPSADEEQSDG